MKETWRNVLGKDITIPKDVEADQNDIVGEQHEPSEFVSKSSLAKSVVSKITYCTIISFVSPRRGIDPS